jgi:DNA-binding MarR family transcriptional regulator
LDDQIGFILRRVYQRHSAIFSELFGEEITATQWAAIAKLHEVGECSQNLLGRYTAMDIATIKGVIERLAARGYVQIKPDPTDRRRLLLSLSGGGKELYVHYVQVARHVTELTLQPLPPPERNKLLRLLERLK